MYDGKCHCGNVCFSVTATPEKLVDCNCSLCRRLGALWGHVPVNSVTVTCAPGSTTKYAQGDKTLAVVTCGHCGCTTHYESLQKDGEYMAVNFRMCDPDVVSGFTIRKFDGADLWAFID